MIRKHVNTINDCVNDITDDSNKKLIVGKKIEKIRFNEEYLVFEFHDSVFAVGVEGDCCSTSYFYDFYGVEAIIGHVVEDIVEIELDPTDLKASHNGDCIEVYGYKITCKNNGDDDDYNIYGSTRTGVFSFRNDSNGYYGGYLCAVSEDFKYEHVPEITKDVLGV